MDDVVVATRVGVDVAPGAGVAVTVTVPAGAGVAVGVVTVESLAPGMINFCPTKMVKLRKPLAVISALTDVPALIAMRKSVSPARTVYVEPAIKLSAGTLESPGAGVAGTAVAAGEVVFPLASGMINV